MNFVYLALGTVYVAVNIAVAAFFYGAARRMHG